LGKFRDIPLWSAVLSTIMLIIIIFYLNNKEAEAPLPGGGSTLVDINFLQGIEPYLSASIPYLFGVLIISLVMLVAYKLQN
jgi:hypothetical protein